MKAIELLEKHYPDTLKVLEGKFPEFVETARRVEVIPWREEFQVADRNPEVIDEIEFWETLTQNGLVSLEEARNRVDAILKEKGYSSKTMGIAFIEAGEVSFRTEVPPLSVLLHEIGHVHFREPDPVWSSVYGGGETLFWLALKKDYPIGEEEIRRFHSLFKRAQQGEHLEVAKEVVEKVASLWGKQIVPAFYPICLGAGWLPSYFEEVAPELDPFDLTNPEWEKVLPHRNDVVSFFVNLTEGVRFGDPFWVEYARRLGILK
ncbi:hypothetical protein Theam_1776 (plasmid) [Thermovibrio ammonificans HB-1]|uniref:Uncharacterized protein n=1 Tax=Thermovibrio ammonificans (strain DSM 15698 / JCM 12110 / HB-1) TaxID=648996 RepID=E8T711_THEA1|nr:hypothetical protein [Thermovibrio ammonificans]ADU97732.1 hypothetical protein Theam_1776 [Thermovibrio ammonificans HB-1]